jgi:hypothetical protein
VVLRASPAEEIKVRRWLFVFVVFAVMFGVACGVESVSQVSARVEEFAFLIVPAVFMIAAIIGLGMRRHV